MKIDRITKNCTLSALNGDNSPKDARNQSGLPTPIHLYSELIESESLIFSRRAICSKYLLHLELKGCKISFPLTLLSSVEKRSPVIVLLCKGVPERDFVKYTGACKVIGVSESDLSKFRNRLLPILKKATDRDFAESELTLTRWREYLSLLRSPR